MLIQNLLINYIFVGVYVLSYQCNDYIKIKILGNIKCSFLNLEKNKKFKRTKKNLSHTKLG